MQSLKIGSKNFASYAGISYIVIKKLNNTLKQIGKICATEEDALELLNSLREQDISNKNKYGIYINY